MAARKDPRHTEEVRQKIQTSQLVNRLTDHVLKDVEMSKSQVSAALGLLKKTLPDLSNIENTHIGDAERPIVITSSDGDL